MNKKERIEHAKKRIKELQLLIDHWKALPPVEETITFYSDRLNKKGKIESQTVKVIAYRNSSE